MGEIFYVKRYKIYVRLRSGLEGDPFLGSLKQKSDRSVPRVLYRLFACVLVPVLWIGLPAVAGAQSAKGKKADSSHERQLQANPGRSLNGSVKLTPDQPPNSFIQYGDIWGCNDGFDKLANTCVSIFAKFGGQPENSYVQYGTIWGCKRGFRREDNKCESIFTKKKMVLKKSKFGKSPAYSSR